MRVGPVIAKFALKRAVADQIGHARQAHARPIFFAGMARKQRVERIDGATRFSWRLT